MCHMCFFYIFLSQTSQVCLSIECINIRSVNQVSSRPEEVVQWEAVTVKRMFRDTTILVSRKSVEVYLTYISIKRFTFSVVFMTNSDKRKWKRCKRQKVNRNNQSSCYKKTVQVLKLNKNKDVVYLAYWKISHNVIFFGS